MHKSKGNSIPFDEAADRIGADVMRWMYAAANPAANLRFGYGPAHEVVRRFFLPLWNTYGFFVTYARLDGWTPDQADGVDGARTLLDRWILSRLDSARRARCVPRSTATTRMRATRAIEAFVEDLSNWYVRRNRRRFWKGELDADKRAAYATLLRGAHHAGRLLAPIIPHLADAMWDNLVASVDADAPDSVHLTDFPVDRRRTCRPGRRGGGGPRAPHGRPRPRRAIRIRRPDSPATASGAREAARGASRRFARRAGRRRGAAASRSARSSTCAPSSSSRTSRRWSSAGSIRCCPSSGRGMARRSARSWPARARATGSAAEDGTVEVGGVTLQPDEFELTARARPGHEVAEDGDLLVALDTEVDAELAAEGLAREVAHRLQAMRKAAGYEISDRVRGGHRRRRRRRRAGSRPHADWLAEELLATELAIAPAASLAVPDRRGVGGARRRHAGPARVARA